MIAWFNIAAWGASAAIAAWLLFDLLSVDRKYDETFLTSSHEGDIVDTEVAEKAEGLL